MCCLSNLDLQRSIRIEGIVSGCYYSNKTTLDFPESPIYFRLGDDKPFDKTYFLTGKNKPPLQNGQYVKGEAFPQELRPIGTVWPGTAFVVSHLLVFASQDGQLLAEYGFN